MQQSVEYERNKFQEFLEKQPSKATLWIILVIYCIIYAVNITFEQEHMVGSKVKQGPSTVSLNCFDFLYSSL